MNGPGTPSLMELLASAWYDRYAIAIVFFFILIMASVLFLALPPTYQASASLAILPSPEYAVRPEAGTRPYAVASLSLDQLMTAETEILDSPNLHASVIRRIGLAALYPSIAQRAAFPADAAKDRLRPTNSITAGNVIAGKRGERAIRRFEASLSVTASKDGNLITVKFSHRRRDIAADAVNTLLRFYAEERRDLYDDPQIKIVAAEVEMLRRQAVAAEGLLASYMTTHDLADFAVQRDLLLKRKDALEAADDANRQHLEQLGARSALLTQDLGKQPVATSIYTERDSDQRIADLDKSIADATTRLKLGEIDYPPQSRRLAKLTLDVATRQADRESALNDLRASIERFGPNPLREEMNLELSQVNLDVAAARASQSVLRQQLSDIEVHLHNLTSEAEALDRLQQQKEMTEGSYAEAKRILAERELTEAEDQWRLARVRVIQDARVPQFERPWRFLILVAGSLLGAVASTFLAITRCATRQIFLCAQSVERLSGIPVLADFLLPYDEAPVAAISK